MVTNAQGRLECAPNGTCWPADYTPRAEVRITRLSPEVVKSRCARLLERRWQLQPGKRYIACTVFMKDGTATIYLPTHLERPQIREGWTLELLERYERANADGLTIYPDDGPARRIDAD